MTYSSLSGSSSSFLISSYMPYLMLMFCQLPTHLMSVSFSPCLMFFQLPPRLLIFRQLRPHLILTFLSAYFSSFLLTLFSRFCLHIFPASSSPYSHVSAYSNSSSLYSHFYQLPHHLIHVVCQFPPHLLLLLRQFASHLLSHVSACFLHLY